MKEIKRNRHKSKGKGGKKTKERGKTFVDPIGAEVVRAADDVVVHPVIRVLTVANPINYPNFGKIHLLVIINHINVVHDQYYSIKLKHYF